mmetsp:Transcript_19955/g.29872  ORF Transcript_19955/g.29872 Transcript_19955/m.29872 type:complete len:342 (+) Transcript_19955:14-1039(+)
MATADMYGKLVKKFPTLSSGVIRNTMGDCGDDSIKTVLALRKLREENFQKMKTSFLVEIKKASEKQDYKKAGKLKGVVDAIESRAKLMKTIDSLVAKKKFLDAASLKGKADVLSEMILKSFGEGKEDTGKIVEKEIKKREQFIEKLTKEMKEAAAATEFTRVASLKEKVEKLGKEIEAMRKDPLQAKPLAKYDIGERKEKDPASDYVGAVKAKGETEGSTPTTSPAPMGESPVQTDPTPMAAPTTGGMMGGPMVHPREQAQAFLQQLCARFPDVSPDVILMILESSGGNIPVVIQTLQEFQTSASASKSIASASPATPTKPTVSERKATSNVSSQESTNAE